MVKFLIFFKYSQPIIYIHFNLFLNVILNLLYLYIIKNNKNTYLKPYLLSLIDLTKFS